MGEGLEKLVEEVLMRLRKELEEVDMGKARAKAVEMKLKKECAVCREE